MGRYDAASEALEDAVRLARQGHDLDAEIEAVVGLLRHAPERGKQGDVLRWVEPLLPRLEAYPISPRKLAFFNAYAYFLVQTLQFDEGLRVAQQTVEMAGTLGDDNELARSRVVLGHLLLWHGRGSETETVLTPVVEYLENTGKLPDAMRSASLRALQLARQVGDAAQAVYETCMLGYLHFRLGTLDLAWTEGLQAVAEARELDRSTVAGSPLGLLATLSWMQGRWEDLARYAGEMISLSDHTDEPWWRRHGEHILALRDLVEEQPARVLARMEPLLLGIELDMQQQTLFLPALAEAYLKTGNRRRAQEVLDDLLALPGRELRGSLTDALRVQAMLLRTGGNLTGAEKVLDDLLELTRSMPYPFGEAEALTEYAHLEATRNRVSAAQERLEEALIIFRRLDAQPFVRRAERLLTNIA
jgi:tetratricopeptide (TPR) repeat protein